MAIPEGIEQIVFLVPKSVVEEHDLNFMLNTLNALIVDENTIRKFKGQISVGFGGYDDDPREVYEIQEIRDYIQAITLKFPYWFYFCSRTDHTLWIILVSHCRFRKMGPGMAKVQSEDAIEITTFLFNSLNDFFMKHKLDEAELASLSREISDYYATQQIPPVSLL